MRGVISHDAVLLIAYIYFGGNSKIKVSMYKYSVFVQQLSDITNGLVSMSRQDAL